MPGPRELSKNRSRAKRGAKTLVKKGRSPAGRLDGSGAALFFEKSGRPAGQPTMYLASQPCIWLPPSILGVYYWYWYIIECIFLLMGGIFPIMGGIFPILSCPPEACPLLASSEPAEPATAAVSRRAKRGRGLQGQRGGLRSPAGGGSHSHGPLRPLRTPWV